MNESPINAAIRFEPDAFDMTGPLLMGRQAAGYGFLRAAIAAHGQAPLVGYGPALGGGKAFAGLVGRLDPAAKTDWVRSDNLDRLGEIGVCYRPDPALGKDARLRLRVGAARYSLCGVTHTLSSGRAADSVTDLLVAPMMPWDAVISTSTAGLAVVESMLDEQAAYLAWRFPGAPPPPRPQLPVIPLGVHAADYDRPQGDRTRARAALAIGEGEVAALYAGRLALSDKAHPFAMLVALQAAAERTTRSVALIVAGRFADKMVETAWRSGVETFCPKVRCIFVDGGQFDAYQDAWAAADFFVSAADSVQETFGLTPLEAMAAGLPCVVSDWNGYRDTVRDGIDGFRVRTWAPPVGAGEPLARIFETEVIGDGMYCWRMALSVAVDLEELTGRLGDLIDNADLRRRMGEAGRQRARETFEWSVVYRQYQALWGELNDRRRAVSGRREDVARVAGAPRATAGRFDPFKTFAHYATGAISEATLARLAPGASLERYREIAAHGLFMEPFRGSTHATALLAALGADEASVASLAQRAGMSVFDISNALAILTKMGVVRLREGGEA